MNMVKKNHPDTPVKDSTDMDKWFSDFIDNIKVDHFMMQTNIAPNEKIEFYNALVANDLFKIFAQTRESSSQYFIRSLVFDYVEELKKHGKMPLKLALGISDSKILVWSEINDSDDEMEDILLMAEAVVNQKYLKNGFYVNSTIIEKSDNAPMPNHYQTIIAH